MSVSGQVMGLKKAQKKEQLRRYATNRTTRLSSFYFKYHLLNQMCSSKSSTFSFSKAWILTIIIIFGCAHPHDDDHAALPTAGAHSQEAERQPRLGEEDARRDGRLRHLPLPLDRVS